MNFTWLKGLIDQLVTFFLRPRHLGVRLMGLSTMVLLVLAGGFAFELRGFAGIEVLKFSSGEGLPGYLVAITAYLALVTWVIGLVMAVATFRREGAEADARRVLVVELRGLVDTSDRPLLGSLPPALVGLLISTKS